MDRVTSSKCQRCEGIREYRSGSKDLCNKCYFRTYREKNREKLRARARNWLRRKTGIPLDQPIKDGSQGTINYHGYRVIHRKGHPNSLDKNGMMYEHTFVMSQHLGRPLLKGENIHHKNGIRHDNRLENLELWSTKQPIGQRVEDKITFYKCFLESYGYTVQLPEAHV